MGKEHEILTNQDMGKEYGKNIPQSRQERDTVGMENEEIDRTVTAGQADITSMLCNLLRQQSAPDVDLDVLTEILWNIIIS